MLTECERFLPLRSFRLLSHTDIRILLYRHSPLWPTRPMQGVERADWSEIQEELGSRREPNELKLGENASWNGEDSYHSSWSELGGTTR